jgi:hypothetical protein
MREQHDVKNKKTKEKNKLVMSTKLNGYLTGKPNLRM